MCTNQKNAGMAPVYDDWSKAMLAAENFIIETTGRFLRANAKLKQNGLETEDDYDATFGYAEMLENLHSCRLSVEGERNDLIQ